MSHPGRFVFVDPIGVRAVVRTTTEIRAVGIGVSVSDLGAERRPELLLADVDPTRSLVRERALGQTRALLK